MSVNFQPDVRRSGIWIALAALMLATRMGHFGFLGILPDASWAVFFLGGFYLRGRFGFAFASFFALAVLIDGLSIAMGVSGWCFTPAYVFLLPSYALLWGGGICARRAWSAGLRYPLLWAGFFAAAAVFLCFMLSNLGFYLFSGHFSALGAMEYAVRVAQYLPGYLWTTGMWLAAAALLHMLVQRFETHFGVFPSDRSR